MKSITATIFLDDQSGLEHSLHYSTTYRQKPTLEAKSKWIEGEITTANVSYTIDGEAYSLALNLAKGGLFADKHIYKDGESILLYSRVTMQRSRKDGTPIYAYTLSVQPTTDKKAGK